VDDFYPEKRRRDACDFLKRSPRHDYKQIALRGWCLDKPELREYH